MKILVGVVLLVLAGCSAGKAVKVDCDGPFTLINPVVKTDGTKAPAATSRAAEVAKP